MEVSREFERSIGALDGLFGFVAEQLPDGVDERVALHVNLAVEEIFTNMVRHNEAGGDHIAVAVEVTGGGIRVLLADFDVEPFDPDSAPEPDVDLPLAERRAGGLGLHLVKSVVDRLVYEYDDRVMRVSFIKSLDSPHV
jgi:anti-sigma regulatory factor (Ser/Thr protein kinase)